MDPQEVQRLIAEGLPGSEVTVTGDGSHFDATVVYSEFAGLSPVKKQQMVYATLGDRITNGTIHALSIRAMAPGE